MIKRKLVFGLDNLALGNYCYKYEFDKDYLIACVSNVQNLRDKIIECRQET